MTEKHSLNELLKSVSHRQIRGCRPCDIFIAEIKSDSRQVGESDLFIALAGEKEDGHKYVDKVIESGCAAVVVEDNKIEDEWLMDTATPVFAVPSTRDALAEIASSFYGSPENELKFLGVTGTNGKTTVTYLLENALLQQGVQVGVIGTVNYRYSDSSGALKSYEAPLTTPGPLILEKTLRQMVDAGVTTVIMEVSSHALDQHRLGNIQFDFAAFTNLSHDHLDYHLSEDEYFRAKTRLFTQYLHPWGRAVVTYPHGEDQSRRSWSSALAELLTENGITYVSCGSQKICDIYPEHIKTKIDRTEMVINCPSGPISLTSPLVGKFNVDNIMTTLAILEVMGHDIDHAAGSIADMAKVPGRLERIRLPQQERAQATIFVDYAHTPDALLNVLTTLQVLPHSRLFCVFGCGGDRDKEKRPKMGKIAAELADVVIVTEDNPRSENSRNILKDIMVGVRQAGMTEQQMEWLFDAGEGRGCVVIADREEAIHRAVNSAAQDDIVVIAGKGHEKYQLTNRGRRFFDDNLVVCEAMASWDIDSIAAALAVAPQGIGSRCYVTTISTDSRKIQKDQVFVALRGDNFDGHDYIDKAVNKGAGAVIVSTSEKMEVNRRLAVFKVADTLYALGELAAYWRSKMRSISSPTIIGITGSCGKTTVKEMTAAIFKQQWPESSEAPAKRVVKSLGNFNNLIGLPLSLMRLQVKHKVAVVEMGMNRPGEIARLAEIADPDISCIVNVHGAHLEGLGSLEGVARAKEELFSATHSRGTLVVNLDDERIVEAAAKYSHNKISFSSRNNNLFHADLWASNITTSENGAVCFDLHIKEKVFPVQLQVVGVHNVENCLAAAAIAHAAGIRPAVIVNGLEHFVAVDKRLQVVSATAGYNIIDDTYNASPASMSAGLTTLASMNGAQKIAVLGDMLELGEKSVSAHRDLGRVAAQSGLAFLLTVGSFAQAIAQGAVAAGMRCDNVLTFTSKADVVAWIKKREDDGKLYEDSWLLIKASRGMRLETIVEELVP